MQPDAYANIVELYDLEHADFTDDVELLAELAELGDGPILELGCGTGRVLLPLAEAGHEVTGIDHSQPMLDVAAQRAQDQGLNVSLVNGDMSDLSGITGGPFGLVIASLNSIMHLDIDQQRSLVKTSFATLKPGGRLIIDTLNPSISQLNHLLDTLHLEGSWTDKSGAVIDKTSYRKHGEEPQVLDTVIWYDRVESNGEHQRIRTRFDLRYVHQSELALLLEIAGYAHVDWYGSYELDPWDPESDRIIAIAHKDHA